MTEVLYTLWLTGEEFLSLHHCI